MQSRTRLQGRWNGISSLESRAGLNNKAGGMEFFMECHTGLDKECRWNGIFLGVLPGLDNNASGMEFFLGCQAGLNKECSWNGILLGVLSRVG